MIPWIALVLATLIAGILTIRRMERRRPITPTEIAEHERAASLAECPWPISHNISEHIR